LGEQLYYDKRHLFAYGGEDLLYTPGNRTLIVPFRGFNIAIQICYDLRFPVWSRNRNLSYDIMINIANWPSGRVRVTEPLSRARAIENQSYFAFVNRSGSDPENSYDGNRNLYDYMGDAVVPDVDGDHFSVYRLEHNSLNSFREKFPAWRDADNFYFGKEEI
jgi:predicted amidohydrolase